MSKTKGFLVGAALGLFAMRVYGQQHAPAFGTTNTTLYRVGTTEFKAYTNSDEYFDGGHELWPGLSATGIFNATPHLPSGALITYVELDFCDTNTALHMLLHFQECDPVSGACTEWATLSSGYTPGTSCSSSSVDLSAFGHTVDNATEALTLNLNFGAFDGTNRLRGVVIGYKLQVSPAPPTPTFNDVPTTDPGFQFIEALAASGITGGCGGGNYCPDNPVTRRQIAIMLAKALGLSFH